MKVAALTDYKNVIVFNIKDKTTAVVTRADIDVDELGEAIAVAPSGDNIVLTGSKQFDIHDEVTEDILGYIWNSKNGRESLSSSDDIPGIILIVFRHRI